MFYNFIDLKNKFNLEGLFRERDVGVSLTKPQSLWRTCSETNLTANLVF